MQRYRFFSFKEFKVPMAASIHNLMQINKYVQALLLL